MIAFRHADRRFPFLWDSAIQPAARWHAEGSGPVQYLSDTADGAWAEFLRHEEIIDAADLNGVSRAIWAVEIEESAERLAEPVLPRRTAIGGPASYPACRREAQRLQTSGATGMSAPSAALLPRTPSGWRVDAGLQAGAPRDERTIVLFGRRPDLTGWAACDEGRPRADLLVRVRHS